MKNHTAILRGGVSALVLLATLLLAPPSATATLTEFFSATGKLSLSVDAGSPNQLTQPVQVDKPNASATVRNAYVMAANCCSGTPIPNNSISISGTPISWDQGLVNSTFFFNVRADVTSIVKPIVDAAAVGRINFTFASTVFVDGVVLAVVFDDPAQPRDTTIILLFGGQALTGDTFAITLGEPIDKAAPGARANMGLGISFGFQGSSQFSIVNVNGQRLTTSAGGQDDSAGGGGLITVGGLDDSNTNPPNPNATPVSFRDDDEFYSLLPLMTDTDTSITVFTQNPSNDDNILFAYFDLSAAAIIGEGILLSPTSAINQVGTDHTVTAKVADDNGNPVQGVLVTFTVTSGPNAGETGTDETDANGEATFTYTGGGGAGTDEIQASFLDSQENTKTSNTVTKTWESDCVDEPDAPCIVEQGEVEQLFTVVRNGQTITTPGAGIVINYANLNQLLVHKEGETVITLPCNANPPPEGSGLFVSDLVVSLPDGTVLGKSQAKNATKKLRDARKKLLKAQKKQKTARLVVPSVSGEDLVVKMFQFDPEAQRIAREAGCVGVTINYFYTITGQGVTDFSVTGSGSVDWPVEP